MNYLCKEAQPAKNQICSQVPDSAYVIPRCKYAQIKAEFNLIDIV